MADRDACILLWRVIGMSLGLLLNFVTSITPFWGVNVGTGQFRGQIMNFGIFYVCKKEIPWCFLSIPEFEKIPEDSTDYWTRVQAPRWLITCQFFSACGLALSLVGIILGCCQSMTDRFNKYGKRGRFAVALVFLTIALFNLIVVGIWCTVIKLEFMDIILKRWKQLGNASYEIGWTCYLAFFTILVYIVTGVLFLLRTGEDEEGDDDDDEDDDEREKTRREIDRRWNEERT